jgi:hypothetical protein
MMQENVTHEMWRDMNGKQPSLDEQIKLIPEPSLDKQSNAE